MKRFSTSLCAAASAATVGLVGPAFVPVSLPPLIPAAVPTASALPFPMSPTDSQVRSQWISPEARSQDAAAPVRILLESINPTTPAIGDTIRVRLRITNHGTEPVRELSVQAQRAGRQETLSDARSILASNSQAFTHQGPKFSLPDQLNPEQETIIDVELPTAEAQRQSLGVSEAGVYPLLLSVNGNQGQGTSYLGSTHFLLSIADSANSADTGKAPPQPTPRPAAMTLLWPLSANIDIIAGETGTAPGSAPLILANENLAAELAQGGRLYQLLDAYTQATAQSAVAGDQMRTGSCLALDPQLIDTVFRMAQGYSVSDQRPSPVAPKLRLRDSWGTSADDVPSTPGSAPLVAGEWLAKLRNAADNSCVVALPWANTDINALGRTGNEWLLREALSQGAMTIENIVGVKPLHNVVVPGAGYVTEQTAARLGVSDTPTGDDAEQAGAGADTNGQGEDVAVARTPEDAWEYAQEHAEPSGGTGGASTGEASSSAETALSDTSLPNPDNQARLPQPSAPVRVLVADNTVWGVPRSAQFSSLAPGIMGVSYQSSLSATLATLGTDPETVGYSNPTTRFDFRIDSPVARSLTAQSALHLGVNEAAAQQDAPPVVVMPPALLSSVDDARSLLATASELFATGKAQPVALDQVITPSPQQQEQLHTAALGPEAGPRFGAPFADPTIAADTEVLRATQQGNYIDDLSRLMVNDPVIALTRYQFTAPLQRDVLRALTLNSRRSMSTYDATVRNADTTLNLNREMLVTLRKSVTLLPPGNVYTRTSDSSPLLIVARNGLPLPVDAHIMYDAPDDVVLHAPEQQRIPARGSITLHMTADIPNDRDRTDITLWLATPAGEAISDSVRIGVQTRAGLFGAYGVATLIIGLVFALVFRVRRGVKRSQTLSANRETRGELKSDQTAKTTLVGGSEPLAKPRRPESGQADQNSGSPRPPGR